MKATLWFNRGLSSTVHVINFLRQSLQPGEELRIITSHIKHVAAADVSDLFVREPKELDADEGAYLDWYFNFATANGVNVFIPRNLNYALARQQKRYDDAGVRLVVTADAPTMLALKNKATLYRVIGPDIVPLPAYRVANSLDEFRSAAADLQSSHGLACFKPTEGIGGRGFYVISDDREIYSPWNGNLLSVKTEAACELLGQRESFKPQMLMEWLPGQERSVDCLAHNGELVAGIVRLKSMDGKDELLEDNPLLIEACRRLTRKLRLNGLFNVQFMEKDGVHYFLEINARMAGGVYFGYLTGVFLPYWAVKLALGYAKPSDVPTPKTGIRVCRETCTVIG